MPKSSENQSLLDLMTTGVTTRLQRKSRTSRPSTTSSSADNASSNSISRPSNAASAAPLPTHTVTLDGNIKSNQDSVKEEIDPLSETPAPGGRSTRRASATTEQQQQQQQVKIKDDPDGDVVMKTDTESNNWSSSYPPNGIKRELKPDEIKQEDKSGADDVTMKDVSQSKDDGKKIEIKKEGDDKENEDGEKNNLIQSTKNVLIKVNFTSVKNKNSSTMEINDDEWNDVEAR
jgi:hypothetical protein